MSTTTSTRETLESAKRNVLISPNQPAGVYTDIPFSFTNFEILKTEIVRVIILAGGESRHSYQIEI